MEIGSLWRKWDLHIHTMTSYDYKLKKKEYSDESLVEKWSELGFAAVAITDHFKIDVERLKLLKSLCNSNGITLFPGIELRTNQGANNVHIIAIFSENTDIDKLGGTFEYSFLPKAINGESPETIYWDIKDIEEFIRSNNGIITVHAGNKASGIDKTMTNDRFFAGVKKQYANLIDVFEVNNEQSYISYKASVIKFLEESEGRTYPVIISSDNHDYSNYELSSYLWIKADPTFEGLKQAILHPDERIFVGNKPPKLVSLEHNPKVVIDEVEIKKVSEGNDTPNWFEQKIKLNPGLVAIIGNKGSGKSALSDVIGTLTESVNKENLAFLKKDRFNKSPNNYGQYFEANLRWYDGKQDSMVNLLLEDYKGNFEFSKAQYLPQTYIEKTCSDIDNKFFQEEINKVIFSYIPSEERLGSQTFSEFISLKTQPIQSRIESIKINLNDVIERIIELEKKKTKEYSNIIVQKLILKQEELERQEKLKPLPVEKPTDLESLTNDKEIENLREQMDKVNVELQQRKQNLTIKTIYHQKILNVQSKLEKIVKEIDLFNTEVKTILNNDVESGLIKIDIPDLFYSKEIENILFEIDTIQTESTNFEKLNREYNKRIIELTESTTLKNKVYQEFINKQKAWHESIDEIKGNIHTIDSLAYLKNELEYINGSLEADYNQLILERNELISEIFGEKLKISKLYDDIYTPIEELLTELLGEIRDDIKFKTNFVIDNKKMLNVLQNINRRPQSLFQGVIESEKNLLEIVEKHDWEDVKAILEAVQQILTCGLEDDFDRLEKVISDKKVFYTQVMSLEYLGIDFQLTYQDTDLTELSPGERGLVLLTFYLALSKDNTPIIIDQPEDNLDNQSVFSKLVPCILQAKKKRQVIIVTHNPNIAIACDAEQIIVANMNKSTKEIRYTAGSIENTIINEKLIEILEGTRPAFDLREAKYLKI